MVTVGGVGQIQKTKAFWEGEEISVGDSGQKSASLKCGGFFCIDPGTSLLLLELKHRVLSTPLPH